MMCTSKCSNALSIVATKPGRLSWIGWIWSAIVLSRSMMNRKSILPPQPTGGSSVVVSKSGTSPVVNGSIVDELAPDVDVLELVAPVAVAGLLMSTGAPLVLGASSPVVVACTVVISVETLEV